MPKEYLSSLFHYEARYHRIIQGLLGISIVIARVAGYITPTWLMIYYLCVLVATAVFDFWFIIHSDRETFRPKVYSIKVLFYLLAMIAGGIMGTIGAEKTNTGLPFISIHVLLLLYGIFMICEVQFFNDIFDSVMSIQNFFIYGALLAIAMLLPYRGYFDKVWIVFILLSMVIVYLILFLLRHLSQRSVIMLEKKNTNLFFENLDIREENASLIHAQERLAEVNETINYQRIQLNDALSDLKKRGEETRTLIDIMEYFTSTFELEESMKYMIDRVAALKNLNICAIMVDADVCLNEEQIFETWTDKNYGRERLKRETIQIYEEFKKSGSRDPMIICNNYDHVLPYFERRGCCITAIPAYEKDTLYGVMILAGERYDHFYGGYDFYNTVLVDFTTAMIKDRLYRTTEDMAKKDGLTKIYNRIYFNTVYPEMLKKAEETGKPISVLMLDIDHFKNVNDTYGHIAGDQAIRSVAKSDWEIAKKYGGMAVRFGGEEFLLILEDTPVERAREIAAELHEKVRTTPIPFEGIDISINTSLGVATYPTTVQETEKTLDRADKAMYYGKTHGRGRIVVDGVDNVD
ncbi:MAG: diguanylate cyclase [Eubacterium sp.]|nr:diguanylate cyclase [Eubacterium sp.]